MWKCINSHIHLGVRIVFQYSIFDRLILTRFCQRADMDEKIDPKDIIDFHSERIRQRPIDIEKKLPVVTLDDSDLEVKLPGKHTPIHIPRWKEIPDYCEQYRPVFKRPHSYLMYQEPAPEEWNGKVEYELDRYIIICLIRNFLNSSAYFGTFHREGICLACGFKLEKKKKTSSFSNLSIAPFAFPCNWSLNFSILDDQSSFHFILFSLII